MQKRYNLKAGLIFSVTIALLATVLPRAIRFEAARPITTIISFAYLSFMLFFYWTAHHFFLITFTSGSLTHRWIKAAASILSSVLIVSLAIYLLKIASRFPLDRNPNSTIPDQQAFFIRLFRGTIISALTYFAVFYYRMLLMLQQSRLENEYLKQENLQAHISTLRQQISPHFLFNSLNTLSTLSNEELVKNYILKMSDVYRYVLHHQEQQQVPVCEELTFIRSYIYILESRFEDALQIDIDVSPAYLNRKIIPFALQLLVENATKHNSVSYKHPLNISIYCRDEKLVVENDLRPRATIEHSSGTGLHNLARRYRLTTGQEITITRNDSKFKVEIPFLP
ncbi:MAG: histidine kinase [Bacteroidetes bacterium]|nr:histidine kinase [Bacteroidota bacterium]